MSEESTCRHEYVIIYQRKLKDLERRLVGTRAYLPVGFKMVDFKHLSPGSFCFCTRCRKRLFPKRTQAEKEAARLERKRLKEEELAKQVQELGDGFLDQDKMEILATPVKSTSGLGWNMKASGAGNNDDEDEDFDDDDDELEDSDEGGQEVNDEGGPDINVDELEVESVDVDDIRAEGVKISPEDDMDESCDLDDDQDD